MNNTNKQTEAQCNKNHQVIVKQDGEEVTRTKNEAEALAYINDSVGSLADARRYGIWSAVRNGKTIARVARTGESNVDNVGSNTKYRRIAGGGWI